MIAPVNVTPADPDLGRCTEKWKEEAGHWKELNPGNPDFNPLTIKAGYVIGIIYSICESVSCLLGDQEFARRTSYTPAYGILASGIEILGRCVKGESCFRRSALWTGFKWLAKPDSASYSEVSEHRKLITTTQRPDSYTIEELVYLRHYAAHGQATQKFRGMNLDFEIIVKLHPLLRDGLEHYWSNLTSPGNDMLSANLAKANIIPLRDWPVCNCLLLFSKDRSGRYCSVTELFNEFACEWTV